MNDVNQAAERLADFSAFTGLTRSDPSDRFFLVIGMTGSGKSSFIASCTDRVVTVGHGLYSCEEPQELTVEPQTDSTEDTDTKGIDVFDFKWEDRRIFLIDTPGFNDTTRSDMDTLAVLAAYLGASYANSVRIDGVLMLHPISDNRMTASSLRNLQMVQAVCGFINYDNVVIATTMWPDRSSHAESVKLNNREAELLADDRFFGSFVMRGASMFRHCENGRLNPLEGRSSAKRIVEFLIRQSDIHTPNILQIQREMIDESKTLGETAAGIIIAGELYKAQKAHEKELRHLDEEMKSQLARTDAKHAGDLRELREDAERRCRALETQRDMMAKSMQELHDEEQRACKRMIDEMEENFRRQLEAKEEALREVERTLDETRRRLTRWRSAAWQQQYVTKRPAETQEIARPVQQIVCPVSKARQDDKCSQRELRETLVRMQGQRRQLEKKSQTNTHLQETQREVQDPRRQVRQTEQQRDAERQVVTYEKIVEEKKTEVSIARRAFQKFRAQSGNIINGGTNGLAAGITTGVITAGK